MIQAMLEVITMSDIEAIKKEIPTPFVHREVEKRRRPREGNPNMKKRETNVHRFPPQSRFSQKGLPCNNRIALLVDIEMLQWIDGVCARMTESLRNKAREEAMKKGETLYYDNIPKPVSPSDGVRALFLKVMGLLSEEQAALLEIGLSTNTEKAEENIADEFAKNSSIV
jgi:hypothetical protein